MKLLFDQNFSYKFPPHIIWLRSGNSSVDKNAELLLRYATQIQTMISSNETGIVKVIG